MQELGREKEGEYKVGVSALMRAARKRERKMGGKGRGMKGQPCEGLREKVGGI